MSSRRLIGWSLFASALFTITVFFADPAYAQGPVVDGPSNILRQYQSVRTTWLSTAAGYANRLFGILALIEFAWTGIILLLEKTDLQGWTSALIRRMMFVGAFFALLQFGSAWIPAIIDSFVTVGQTASGVPGLSPSNILARGLEITGDLLVGAAESGWLAAFGTALCLVFAALLCFLAFLGLCIQFVVATIESYLVIGAGFLFLGFGGSRWTAPYVERYIAYAVSAGVKIMLIYLLIAAGYTLSAAWVTAAQNIATSTQPAIDALDIAAAAVIFLMICWNAPKLAAALLGGSPALTGGDAVATGGAVIGGAAAVAGLAVAGAALGAKLLAAKGGAMAVSQAANMGAGGGAGGGAMAAGVGPGGGGGGKGGTGAAAAIPAGRSGSYSGASTSNDGQSSAPPSKRHSSGPPLSAGGEGNATDQRANQSASTTSAGTSMSARSESQGTASATPGNMHKDATADSEIRPPVARHSRPPLPAPSAHASEPNAGPPSSDRRPRFPTRSSARVDTSSEAATRTSEVAGVGTATPQSVAPPRASDLSMPKESFDNSQTLKSPQTVQLPMTNSSPGSVPADDSPHGQSKRPLGAASGNPATLENPQSLDCPQTLNVPITTGSPMTVTEPVTTRSSSSATPTGSSAAKSATDTSKTKRRAEMAGDIAKATVIAGQALHQLRGAIPSDAAPPATPPPLNTETHE